MTGLATAPERRRLTVRGTVQGVGFRPYVYRIAREAGLSGWVRNTGGGVEIEVEGESRTLDAFARRLTTSPPPLARIDDLLASPATPLGEDGFRVLESRPDAGAEPPLPVGPDAATCDACLREMRDPDDRRHGYAFINCTDCGPRFTIIRSLPYDRGRTAMAPFAMCQACRAEYEDPGHRRFHAEPIACPRCGPRLRFESRDGGIDSDADPVESAAHLLESGGILALKGLGGYQIACAAADPHAVGRLRTRKNRDAKPFALMVPDLAAARRLCRVSTAEAEALTGPRGPIVLLQRRRERDAAPSTGEPRSTAEARPSGAVAEEVAPGLDALGVMLPYTPLHNLLLDRVGQPLVMTSGNRSGEPIAADDDEARERLDGIADAFLLHDRGIASPYDDSVVRVERTGPMVLRRARGYAPEPLRLPLAAPRPGLAVGGQLKGSFCLVRDHQAFPSQHIGDLDDAASTAHFARTVQLYRRLFRVDPAWVAHDLHPDYASTRFAHGLPEDVRRVGVQHHHAHVVSGLAEHGRMGPALGVCFDGTGYGPDGTVWGGELLLAYWRGYRRIGRLRHLAMPGGDAAAREPWRMAAAALVETFGSDADGVADRLLASIPAARRAPVLAMARHGIHAPLTSSAGRLFDAVAALAGLRDHNRYEGQAAMELEASVDPAESGAYPLPQDDDGVWDTGPLIAAVVDDINGGVGARRIAARFHNGLAAGVAAGCARAQEEAGVGLVVLTGGCFQNRRLTERTRSLLETNGFEVLTHRCVPPNDGGLALGQAAVAVAAAVDSHEEV